MNEATTMAELPNAPIKRIIKNAGAKRVSEDAVEEFRDNLEDMAEDIASDSLTYTRHADRKTVQKQDVKEVF